MASGHDAAREAFLDDIRHNYKTNSYFKQILKRIGAPLGIECPWKTYLWLHSDTVAPIMQIWHQEAYAPYQHRVGFGRWGANHNRFKDDVHTCWQSRWLKGEKAMPSNTPHARVMINLTVLAVRRLIRASMTEAMMMATDAERMNFMAGLCREVCKDLNARGKHTTFFADIMDCWWDHHAESQAPRIQSLLAPLEEEIGQFRVKNGQVEISVSDESELGVELTFNAFAAAMPRFKETSEIWRNEPTAQRTVGVEDEDEDLLTPLKRRRLNSRRQRHAGLQDAGFVISSMTPSSDNRTTTPPTSPATQNTTSVNSLPRGRNISHCDLTPADTDITGDPKRPSSSPLSTPHSNGSIMSGIKADIRYFGDLFLKQIDSRLDQFGEEKRDMKLRIGQLRFEKDQLAMQLEAMQGKLASAESLEDEKAAMQAELEKLRKESAELLAMKAKASEIEEMNAKKLDELKEETGELRNHNARLVNENESLKARKGPSEKDLGALGAELQALKKKHNGLLEIMKIA